ncbi:MAG: type IX secretion system outer membrane channel protein PorV [Bacteroidia bacterium]|nr:type IX secretion system outer membrane channel protein PorV [Bacteroidia bacterium]
MRNTISKTGALLSLFIFVFTGLNAQQDKSNLLGQLNTITTAVPFLLISPDARQGGMGDAGIATEPDAHAIHWNPAKMAFYNGKGLGSVSYTPWLRQLVNDIYLAYATGYYKPKPDQAVGGSVRFFSLGQIDFTDATGGSIGSFNPSEFALDVAYARKLGEEFSGGIALRYIHSNLTGGIPIPGSGVTSKPGNSVAADIAVFYQKDVEVGQKPAVLTAGLAITNIGSKISYTETGDKDFIPINLRFGPGLKLKLNDFNELAFNLDFNKLLVPTPPVYSSDSVGNELILYGKDPKVGVAAGMFQSFSDAPDGFKEELKEINIAGGAEYWYDKQFAFRVGYFFESALKGNRKYFTLGAGLRYSTFGLDFSYLIPTEQRNPLENTLRFSLSFRFGETKKEVTE